MTDEHRKIKVLHVLNRMETGGIQSIVLDYYRTIDKDKFHFDFLVCRNSDCPFEDELVRNGARIIRTPKFYEPISYFCFVNNYLKENQYDIIHSHVGTLSFLPLLVAYRNNIKIRICHIHSITDVKEGIKALTKVILRPFSKMFANVYFSCGKKVAKWMYGDNPDVYIMENAIKVDRFRFDLNKREKIRKECNIPDEALLIGHIGWFIKLKNQQFLVKILERCIQSKENVYLMLIGGGKQVEKIKRMVKDKGLNDRVRFIGNIKDTSDYYSAFDLFCLPSLFEGMPVVTIEAQANGLPTIISDSITREAARNNNCLFLPLDKPEEWIESFHKLGRTDIINVEDIKEKCLNLENKYLELVKEYE